MKTYAFPINEFKELERLLNINIRFVNKVPTMFGTYKGEEIRLYSVLKQKLSDEQWEYEANPFISKEYKEITLSLKDLVV